MTKVKSGDTVEVHYTGRLEDGTVFDSSEGRSPLEFKVGGQQVIKGFEDGVTGMVVADKKTVEIPPENAYGHYRDEMIIKFPKSNFPENIQPEAGMKLQMTQQNGQPVLVTVKEVGEDEVTLDANHHLAGKTLIFDLELVSIK